MAKRFTRKLTRLMTKKEMEQLMADYARLESRREALQQQFQEEKQRLKEKYEAELQELDEQIEQQADQLQHYAETHYAQFTKHRSLANPYGAIGFRLCPPKVRLAEEADPEESLNKLTELKPEFVLVKKKLNKSEILKHRDEAQTVEILRSCGLEIVQDEAFFIEVKESPQAGEAGESDAA